VLDFAKAMKSQAHEIADFTQRRIVGGDHRRQRLRQQPAVNGGAPSDLPFTVLGRLRESGIALSSPQSTVLVTESGEKLQPGK
jgi:hypothetical protein